MTKYTFIALVALFGCTSDGKDTGDTAPADTDTDTDTDTDADVPFAMTGHSGNGFEGSCASGNCVYRITTTAPAGSLELDMTETGDPKYLYTENHTGFDLETTNADGSETYVLTLAWVTALGDVVLNETTLFNPDVGDGGVLDRTTWYFGATSAADSSDMDCRVTGHDPAYYETWCTNVVP